MNLAIHKDDLFRCSRGLWPTPSENPAILIWISVSMTLFLLQPKLFLATTLLPSFFIVCITIANSESSKVMHAEFQLGRPFVIDLLSQCCGDGWNEWLVGLVRLYWRVQPTLS